jgi:hypothetical protein
MTAEEHPGMTFSNGSIPDQATRSANDGSRSTTSTRASDASSVTEGAVGYQSAMIAGVAFVAQPQRTIANGSSGTDVVTANGAATDFPNWRFAREKNVTARAGSPTYHLPLRMIAAAVWTSIRNRKRDLRCDAPALVASMPVAPVVSGIENLPAARPYVILPNHYERPSGAWVGWGPIIISDAIFRAQPGTFPIRLVMTSTWQDCYVGPRRINPKYLHWVLRRMSGLYDLILMPADDVDAFGRGAALRDVFRALSDPAGQVVAFHPEAGGFESLITPPKGIGRVLSVLDRKNIPLIPTGVYEAGGRIHVSFGSAIPAGSLVALGDTEAAKQVMIRIAQLVPEQTRGVFAAEAAAAQAIDG